MKHQIDLTHFLPKGQVECAYKDNMLYMKTKRTIPTKRFDAKHLSINSYIYLPQLYHLPLRIDLSVKMDAPGLYILLGEGHVNIGTLYSDNRRMDDIVSPARKVIFYHNHIEMNKFTDISLIYDRNEMQILIDGEERYYSKKERYMKARTLHDLNETGFELKIACDKLVNLLIKSVSVTEYRESCGIIPSGELLEAVTKNIELASGEKPDFEKCISFLPEVIQNEIVRTDEFLRAQKILKFRRQIEKNGNKITYVASDYGFSYAIYLSRDMFDHSLQWYLITNGKPETWHRKDDRMEDTLRRLADTRPDLAERMFINLEECVGCYEHCLAKTQYRFGNANKIVCHGKLKFTMNVSGFEELRTFVEEINRSVQEV